MHTHTNPSLPTARCPLLYCVCTFANATVPGSAMSLHKQAKKKRTLLDVRPHRLDGFRARHLVLAWGAISG